MRESGRAERTSRPGEFNTHLEHVAHVDGEGERVFRELIEPYKFASARVLVFEPPHVVGPQYGEEAGVGVLVDVHRFAGACVVVEPHEADASRLVQQSGTNLENDDKNDKNERAWVSGFVWFGRRVSSDTHRLVVHVERDAECPHEAVANILHCRMVIRQQLCLIVSVRKHVVAVNADIELVIEGELGPGDPRDVWTNEGASERVSEGVSHRALIDFEYPPSTSLMSRICFCARVGVVMRDG